jgi:hypothetical protein
MTALNAADGRFGQLRHILNVLRNITGSVSRDKTSDMLMQITALP